MARTSIQSLITQATTNFADNTTQLITPAFLRNWATAFLDTMAPAYGMIQRTTGVVVALTNAVYTAIAPFTSQLAATAPDFSANIAGGSVTNLIGTVPGKTTRITVDGMVEGPNNNAITIAIFINGAASLYNQSVLTNGAGNVIGFNFSGLTYQAGVNTVVDVRAIAANAGSAGNYTFSSTTILCENVPVNAF